MVSRVFMVAIVSCPLVASAQAPQLLGYQGRLVKMDGTPESGNAQMRFGLFGTETGGSSLWEETQAVSISQGYYSTFLGRMTMFPATLFDTGTLWLEVAVQAPGDTQFRTMTPRQRVGSVAFALSARSVKGGTVDATSVSINGTQVIDSNGKLTASAGYTAGPGISIDGTTRAISVNSSGCSTGQVLQWSGAAWQCATVSGSGGGISSVTGSAPISVTNGTTAPVISVAVGTTAGTVAAGNDTRFGNATSIAGVAVASSAPATGQLLGYNGTSWSPTSVATGVASVTAGTGLTGGTISTAGTIAIANGGVGSPQLAAGAVTFDKLGAMGCTANQLLRFDGTNWACATPSSSGRSDLSAWFELDEMSGSSFSDSSGNGNTATSTTGGGIAVGSIGRFLRGVAFSGGSLTVAAPVIPITPTISVEAWIQPQAPVAGIDTVVARPGAWALKTTGSEVSFEVVGTAPSTLCRATTNGAALTAGSWAHLVGSYDGQHAIIRVNGSLVVSQTCPNGPLARTASAPLYIGGLGTPNVSEPFNGTIDEVRIRTLPASIPTKYVSDWRAVTNSGSVVSFNHNLGVTPDHCEAYWSTSATGVPKRPVGDFKQECHAAGVVAPSWRGFDLLLDATTVSFTPYTGGIVFCYYDQARGGWVGTNSAFVQIACSL
jgi:hypothetical protein